MNVVFTLGRILIVLPFILSAAARLVDLPGSGQALAAYPLPDIFAGLIDQFESGTGVKIHMPLALAFNALALCAALLMALNVATRWNAMFLLLFMLVEQFYGAFAASVPAEAVMAAARANPYLPFAVGGLLAFVAVGSRRLVAATQEG